MIQSRRRPRLLLEASQPLGIGREKAGQHLDCNISPKKLIACAVHLAHTACPERSEDLVRTEFAASG